MTAVLFAKTQLSSQKSPGVPGRKRSECGGWSNPGGGETELVRDSVTLNSDTGMNMLSEISKEEGRYFILSYLRNYPGEF